MKLRLPAKKGTFNFWPPGDAPVELSIKRLKTLRPQKVNQMRGLKTVTKTIVEASNRARRTLPNVFLARIPSLKFKHTVRFQFSDLGDGDRCCTPLLSIATLLLFSL